MRSEFRAALWLCAAGAGACGCASAPPPTAAPVPPPTTASATSAAVAGNDWRALLIVPFGTLLKDMPLALNEALQFRDAESESGAESRDCFSVDGASPPQVLDRRPQSYLLCFEHDRLHRIEAEVRLAPGEGGPLLAALCAQWLAGAEAVERSADGCTGREGGVDLDMRLEDSSATLSMRLSDIRPVPHE